MIVLKIYSDDYTVWYVYKIKYYKKGRLKGEHKCFQV